MMSDALNKVVRKAINGREYPIGVVAIEERDEARAQSARLREIAEEHGLLGDKLQVPESVFRATEEMQLGFLQALFTADGHVEIGDKSRGAVVLTSKSRRLLQDVQRLLLNFGIYSRIYNDRKAAGTSLLPDGTGRRSGVSC